MSVPFGPDDDFANLPVPAQLRTFEETVRRYAKARTDAAKAGAAIAGGEGPPDEAIRQWLTDAGQELFLAGETLKSYAMVLSGNGVFTTCADLADQGGMAGPY